jgi:hypothetical protein
MREAVQLGDPLVIARNFGKGRVVAVMTTAGRKWNNWAAGGPASFTFPVLMVEMQKYLSSIAGGEASLSVGDDRLFEVDAARFEPFMNVYYQGESKNNEAIPANAGSEDVTKAGLEDFVQVPPLGKDRDAPRDPEKKEKDPEAPKENVVERMRFEYTKARKPGIYFFQFTRRGVEAEGQPRIDTRAFAFNVDTGNESDLRRVTSAEREKVTGKVTEVNVDTTATGRSTVEVVLSDKQSDLSESGWLYLLFLVILIVEQALAVHLSFHLKGSEMPSPAPAAA